MHGLCINTDSSENLVLREAKILMTIASHGKTKFKHSIECYHNIIW